MSDSSATMFLAFLLELDKLSSIRDFSLAVWKQKLISLTELMKTCPGKISLVSTWVQGVFLLILDVEAKASEKVLECICDCLFGNLGPTKRSSTNHRSLPWFILTWVTT